MILADIIAHLQRAPNATAIYVNAEARRAMDVESEGLIDWNREPHINGVRLFLCNCTSHPLYVVYTATN